MCDIKEGGQGWKEPHGLSQEAPLYRQSPFYNAAPVPPKCKLSIIIIFKAFRQLHAHLEHNLFSTHEIAPLNETFF